ncbi:BMP family ABC transporter substrate-binding protein [Microbacterium sorbitolivorans]|uniref:BMP family ABC transporter substrate-binding protein n=1 Tax=Microbacterium sorbitolivorans TaxID=1867410 RepID=UPI0013B053AA|nr:BMP family ABC transporter substrate-binding protein [Microbacterium sorbitolivorans]
MGLRSRVFIGSIAVAVVALLAGCTAPDTADPAPATASPAQQTPTVDPYAPVPEPGRTIEADPPAEARDLAGWVVALVVSSDDAESRSLTDAAREAAEREGALVEEFVADGGAITVESAFDDALAVEPDVVIGLGERTSDVFSYLTAQWLDQQFLIVGAQLPEPTDNVTAVIWEGATSRGSGAPADGDLDAAGTTPARVAGAIAAGLGSVADGTTGVVLNLAE